MERDSAKEHFLERAMVGFIIAVAIAVVGGINTIRYIYVMQNDLRSWYENDLLGQNSIQIARINLLNIDRDLKAILLSREPGTMDAGMKDIKHRRSIFIRQLETARPLFTSGEATRQMEASYGLSRTYLAMLNGILAAGSEGRMREIARLEPVMTATFEKIDKALDKLDDFKQEKDLHVFRTIISENEITMGISVLILVGTIIVRAIQLHASRKRRAMASESR